MTAKRLVVEIDAELIDPTWTDQDLLDNIVHYFASVIDRGESDRANANSAYTVDTSDLTVWTLERYTADLQDLERALTKEN